MCDGGRTVVQAGRDLGLSWPIVQCCFETYADKVLPKTPPETSDAAAQAAVCGRREEHCLTIRGNERPRSAGI